MDEDTFVRFCEFCYLDNYSPPSCGWDGNTEEEITPLKADVQPEAPGSECSELPKSYVSYFATTGKKKKNKRVPDLELLDHEYPLPKRCAQFTEQFKPFPNATSDQDFTPVFLEHARLYVMADKYCIETMKGLVLYKLHTTLKGFTRSPKESATSSS